MKRLYMIVILIIIALGCIILIQPSVCAADEEGNLVIVLDPGHGASDPGASNSRLGLIEAEVNYKISIYTKEELEKYEGVKVYLTRYANCPSIYERGEFAKNYDADLVVSQHINSGSSSARGAEVWVTQDNTQLEYYEKSKELGDAILRKLSALGLYNHGVATRSGQPNEWYASGVVKDYYGIIRYPMNYGIRSILVEHCYISNDDDCRNFISTDEQIRRLAIADAQGIVEAYQLERKGEGKLPVRKMTLDKSELNLEITPDDPEPLNFLNAIITPSNAYNQAVDTYSSDTSIVRTCGDRVRGLREGEVTVTAISRNNQRIQKCKVVVTKPEIPLKDITTDMTDRTIMVDDADYFRVFFNPQNATDQTVYWESSNEDVIRIWYDGHYRGLKQGKAILTATSRAGGKKLSFEVTVIDPTKKHVEDMQFEQDEYEIGIDEAVDLPYKFTPEDASNAEFYWESSNDEVIRVFGNRFRGLKAGTAEVIVKTLDGTFEKRIKVTVKDKELESKCVKQIIPEQEEYEIGIDEAVDIPFTYTPKNAINAEFYWTSSNDEILRVFGNRFRGLKPGTAYVIVKTLDGTVEKRIKVTIKGTKPEPKYVTEIIPEQEEYEIVVDQAVDVPFTYTPEDAVNAEFYWDSSDGEMLRVFGNRFRGLKPGTAYVIARTLDGTVEKKIKVTIRQEYSNEIKQEKSDNLTKYSDERKQEE